MTDQLDKVRKYYDSTLLDYQILWLRSNSWAMHFGYYDQGVRFHYQAVQKMNAVLASLAKITPKDKVLDAGCGYGGSTFWLAKNIGCKVIGLTVVPYQIKRAKEYATKLNLNGKVDFQNEDFANTSFPDKSFDVIWGLESIVHAQSKEKFTREAHRLLRKNGRFLVSEYMLRDNPPLTNTDYKIIQDWLDGWAMPSLLTPMKYKTLLEKAGFNNIKIFDLTEKVLPSLRRLGILAILVLPGYKFLQKLGIINREHLDNVKASVAMYKALKMELWRYTVITAQ